jgi:hypothetical protein
MSKSCSQTPDYKQVSSKQKMGQSGPAERITLEFLTEMQNKIGAIRLAVIFFLSQQTTILVAATLF